ncbi:hypothetical protein [uncultured Roseobacter sp.]|uniref:hypothetical protein n=1 Tax=uncultured Roseobacter sp. TaxID=114847 RepID=UPI002637B4BD|nr:hypothetical protein [uncultured Roseobacter sp.]
MQTLKAPQSAKRATIDRGDVERLPAMRPGFCDHCQNALPKSAINHHSRFCSSACRQTWWKIAKLRGAKLYYHLMVWRGHRGRKGTPGAGRLGMISSMVDRFIQSDRE